MQESAVLITAILLKFKVQAKNLDNIIFSMHAGVIFPKNLKLSFVPLK